MRYFILGGHINPGGLVKLDSLLDGSGVSILPYPHLGMYGDSVILKVPEAEAHRLEEVREKFPLSKMEEWMP